MPRADSATTVLLQDQLIATALGRGKAWRSLSPAPNDARPPREVANEMTLLLADSLAPAVREKWAPFVPVVTAKEWAARDIRAGGTLFTVTGPERVGPFARIRVESSGRVARAADQPPWLYYASTTYYLMELGDEWVIVGVESWVT